MKKITFLVSLPLLLFSSCSKDTDNTGDKLVRIKVGDKVNSEYFYDGAGRMTRFVLYGSTEATNSYDNNGKRIKQSLAVNLSSLSTAPLMDFSYDEYNYGADGKLTETRSYQKINGAYQFVIRSMPTYDPQGRTIAVTYYNPTTNAVSSKRTYVYNAQNNITTEEFFEYSQAQGPYQRMEYEYDDKKNPLKGNWVMPFGANNNNTTKITTTNYYSLSGAYVPAGITSSNASVYKKYTSWGYPAVVNENGADLFYEYQ